MAERFRQETHIKTATNHTLATPETQNTTTLVQAIANRKTAMTVPELAKMLSLSKVSLYDLVKRGSLPALKIGGSIRLDPKQTADWLNERMAA